MGERSETPKNLDRKDVSAWTVIIPPPWPAWVKPLWCWFLSPPKLTEPLCSPDYAETWLEIKLDPLENISKKIWSWAYTYSSEIEVIHQFWPYSVKKKFAVNRTALNNVKDISLHNKNEAVHLQLRDTWFRTSHPFLAVYQSARSYTFPWFLQSKQAVQSADHLKIRW